MVEQRRLAKGLETDSLYFVEGHKTNYDVQIFESEALTRELRAAGCERPQSSGDFGEDIEDKMQQLEQKNLPEMTYFETWQYFDRLFPGLRVQKPGTDYYGSTTLLLAILAIFVLLNFEQLYVSQSDLLESANFNNSGIFNGAMAVCLLTIVFIIFLERYISRTDTKAAEDDKKTIADDMEDKAYFKDVFERSTTARSMTVKLMKTLKTSDLDVQGDAEQQFLANVYGSLDDDEDIDESRTKTTPQQKTKFFLHWTLLIFVHCFVFWWIPVTGNYILYGSAFCDADQVKKYPYGCRNFHDSTYLMIFYALCCLYFMLSSLQIRRGFPIMKKASSILQYNEDALALLGAQVYAAIPFVIEIRCLHDFTFSKTSLDIF